jgi:hypothetical protein
MPRITVSQVCRCESTKPGMTMQSGGVDDLRVAGVERAPDGGDPLALDQKVAREDVAELGIHREYMAPPEQQPLGHAASFPNPRRPVRLNLLDSSSGIKLTQTARRLYRPLE